MLDNITNDSIPFFLPTSSYYHLCVLNKTAQTTEQPTAIKKMDPKCIMTIAPFFISKENKFIQRLKSMGIYSGNLLDENSENDNLAMSLLCACEFMYCHRFVSTCIGSA